MKNAPPMKKMLIVAVDDFFQKKHKNFIAFLYIENCKEVK